MYDERRIQRDSLIREAQVDPDAFRQWMRQNEIENECGTDEYGETQPYKALAMISDFYLDLMAGEEENRRMHDLVLRWWASGANLTGRYDGADELRPILYYCFEHEWNMGGFSLYSFHEEALKGALTEFKEEEE